MPEYKTHAQQFARTILNEAQVLDLIPRERGVYFSVDSKAHEYGLVANQVPVIEVVTRTGGYNRDEYAEFYSEIDTHPLYLGEIADSDSTYNHLFFDIPKEYHGIATAFAEWEDKL